MKFPYLDYFRFLNPSRALECTKTNRAPWNSIGLLTPIHDAVKWLNVHSSDQHEMTGTPFKSNGDTKDFSLKWTKVLAYIGRCLIWLRQTNPIETDMSETWCVLLRLIWARRLNHILQWYDWGAKLTVDTYRGGLNITVSSEVCWIKYNCFI